METIEDILREMRDASNLAPSAIEANNTLLTDSYYDDECQGWLSHYADRIEAAFKREIAVEYHRNDAAFCALLDEYAKLKKCIKGDCERMDLGAEPCTDCPYAEIDRLKDENAKLKDDNVKLRAALEPVLAVMPSAWATTNRFSLGEFQTPVYDGKWCEAAIIESQRIYNEGASK